MHNPAEKMHWSLLIVIIVVRIHRVQEIYFRFGEAISEWDKALNLVPNDYKILEMKAQVLFVYSKFVC